MRVRIISPERFMNYPYNFKYLRQPTDEWLGREQVLSSCGNEYENSNDEAFEKQEIEEIIDENETIDRYEDEEDESW